MLIVDEVYVPNMPNTQKIEFQGVFQDWDSNPHDARIRWVLVTFRLAQWMDRLVWTRILFAPYFLIYRFVVFWLFHMELHWKLQIEEGLQIFHGFSLVIHPNSRIGKHVTLRHCVTLGTKSSEEGAPILEDYVNVGANAVIIGPITVGRHAAIGAGAVVTKNVAAGTIVAGNPATVIRRAISMPEPASTLSNEFLA